MEIHNTEWIQQDIHPGNIAYNSKQQKLLFINWSKAVKFQVCFAPKSDPHSQQIPYLCKGSISSSSRPFTSAPEVELGNKASPSSDVYAAGMVLQYVCDVDTISYLSVDIQA